MQEYNDNEQRGMLLNNIPRLISEVGFDRISNEIDIIDKSVSEITKKMWASLDTINKKYEKSIEECIKGDGYKQELTTERNLFNFSFVLTILDVILNSIEEKETRLLMAKTLLEKIEDGCCDEEE